MKIESEDFTVYVEFKNEWYTANTNIAYYKENGKKVIDDIEIQSVDDLLLHDLTEGLEEAIIDKVKEDFI